MYTNRMHNHAPKNYQCPICKSLAGQEEDYPIPLPKKINPAKQIVLAKQADYIYQDDLVSAFINSFWIPTCEGHVIIVPNQHYENLYDIPKKVGHRVFEVSQIISLAMKKAYQCDGITLRQNNGPAGGQHAFHYHLHIFPRDAGDNFNINYTKPFLSNPKDRIKYANKLKSHF